MGDSVLQNEGFSFAGKLVSQVTPLKRLSLFCGETYYLLHKKW